MPSRQPRFYSLVGWLAGCCYCRCSLKNERGLGSFVRALFSFHLPFSTARGRSFSRARSKVICYRLVTILCLDTCARLVGSEQQERGRESGKQATLLDVQEEISRWNFPNQPGETKLSLAWLVLLSSRHFFSLFRSASFTAKTRLYDSMESSLGALASLDSFSVPPTISLVGI